MMEVFGLVDVESGPRADYTGVLMDRSTLLSVYGPREDSTGRFHAVMFIAWCWRHLSAPALAGWNVGTFLILIQGTTLLKISVGELMSKILLTRMFMERRGERIASVGTSFLNQ